MNKLLWKENNTLLREKVTLRAPDKECMDIFNTLQPIGRYNYKSYIIELRFQPHSSFDNKPYIWSCTYKNNKPINMLSEEVKNMNNFSYYAQNEFKWSAWAIDNS